MFMDSIRLIDFQAKEKYKQLQLTDFIFLELNISNENNVTKIYLALHKKKKKSKVNFKTRLDLLKSERKHA